MKQDGELIRNCRNTHPPKSNIHNVKPRMRLVLLNNIERPTDGKLVPSCPLLPTVRAPRSQTTACAAPLAF